METCLSSPEHKLVKRKGEIGRMDQDDLNEVKNGDVESTGLVNTFCSRLSKNADHLDWNRFWLRSSLMGDEGATLLAGALQSPTCNVTCIEWVLKMILAWEIELILNWTSLYNNRISGKGATSLASALQNPNCKVVEISWVSFDTDIIRLTITRRKACTLPYCKATDIQTMLIFVKYRSTTVNWWSWETV